MITPDDKNWTWVLERPCPECGFDASTCPPTAVAELTRRNAEEWRRLLDRGVIRPGRPDDATWSTLEYACHVRDVFRRYTERILFMQREDDPLLPNMDQDAWAVGERYEEQDPKTVVAELVVAAEALATRLGAIHESEWDRPGRRSDGASFTVATIARYMVHDPIHHVWDVTGRREP
jgi:hypothetical protein